MSVNTSSPPLKRRKSPALTSILNHTLFRRQLREHTEEKAERCLSNCTEGGGGKSYEELHILLLSLALFQRVCCLVKFPECSGLDKRRKRRHNYTDEFLLDL